MIEKFEDCLKLANEFLLTKERKNYYEFKVIDEDFSDYCSYTNELSDKEVLQVRQLKEKYPDDYTKHLDEIFDDPDVIHDFSCGDEIVSIDTDYVIHKYAVTIHELKPDGTVFSFPHSIELKDEEYAKLLAWQLYDVHLTINMLRHRDRSLYDTVMRCIDAHYYQLEGYYWVDNPYVATLDEVKTDAAEILQKYNLKQSSGYLVG